MTAVALPALMTRTPKPLVAAPERVAMLVAMPGMQDPFFAESVILLLDHTDDGAEGLVLNRPAPVALSTVLQGAGVESPRPETSQQQVRIGGPVEPHAGVVLYERASEGLVRPDTQLVLAADAHEVVPGVLLSASMEALRVVSTDRDAGRFGLFLGRAAWGPGQLDQEIRDGAWLAAEVDASLLFRRGTADVWRAALELLGAEPENVVRELAEA